MNFAELIFFTNTPCMQQSFTPELLIQHLYHETGPSQALCVETMLREEPSVREEYRSLREAYRQLPKVQFNPSPRSIQRILRHSATTALTEQA